MMLATLTVYTCEAGLTCIFWQGCQVKADMNETQRSCCHVD